MTATCDVSGILSRGGICSTCGSHKVSADKPRASANKFQDLSGPDYDAGSGCWVQALKEGVTLSHHMDMYRLSGVAILFVRSELVLR